MKNDKKVLEIIKNKVEIEYKDDISMLVVYGKKEENKHETLGEHLYFIPKNEKANNLSTQFIIEGVSYDLFPMRWDRLILNASMDRPQGYLLLDTEVIYYSDKEVLDRFEGLKNSLRIMLSGEYDEALLNKAYEYFNESYIYLYNMQEYKESISSARLESSKLLKKIANALGFINRNYYKSGNGTVLNDSLKLEKLPVDYKNLVEGIIFSESSEEIYAKSLKLVENTRELLINIKREQGQRELFETLFTGYYEELKKSLNKCKIAVASKDYYKLFELFSYMQEEVSQFIAKVEEGIWYDDRNAYIEYCKHFEEIFKIDLLGLICKKDDDKILMAIDNFEKELVSLVKRNNIEILDFKSVEAFEVYFKDK